MIRVKFILLGMLLLSAAAVIGQMNNDPQTPNQDSPLKMATTANRNRGQQVFHQNCSRCHNAPNGLPPRISGTIVKHMRVRAKLSGDDYKALLEFLQQ
jgi:cytochrome c5